MIATPVIKTGSTKTVAQTDGLIGMTTGMMTTGMTMTGMTMTGAITGKLTTVITMDGMINCFNLFPLTHKHYNYYPAQDSLRRFFYCPSRKEKEDLVFL